MRYTNRGSVFAAVYIQIFFGMIFIAQAAVAGDGKLLRVLFLPFEDEVELNESWDLSVDVPRWFSQTVDTISGYDSAVVPVSFESVDSLIRANKWSYQQLMTAGVMGRLAAKYGADYVVGGTVHHFKVMMRGINADASLQTSHTFGKNTIGQGGSPVMGSMNAFTASVRITADVFDRSGARVTALSLDSEKKEGGLEIWLPFQTDNSELNFYRMRQAPFGSEYFQKSVIGAIMNQFSYTLQTKLKGLRPVVGAQPAAGKQYAEGKILERVGQDVYINLGNDDHLFRGEILQVLKPSRPITCDQGDTLGWVETPAGSIEVRYIKSAHFSQALVRQESDSLQVGWTVRPTAAPNGD